MQPHQRRLLFAAMAGVTLLLGASAGVVQWRATASWTAMVEQAAAMQAAWAARDHRRDPLWGDVAEGSAFAHYERAVAMSRPLHNQDFKELVATLRRTDAQVAEEEAAVAMRARWLPVLQAMRDGAHHADARPPDVATKEPSFGIPNLLDCRWIVNAAVFEARALRHEGRHRQAVQWTLDAATFSSDHLRSAPLIAQRIGVALMAIVTEAWPDAALQRLDADSLHLLAAGLERLDRQLPTQLEYDGELRLLAHALQQQPIPGAVPDTLAAWRFGFSTRWMLADAFAHLAAAMADAAGEQALAWPQREAHLAARTEQLATSNPASAYLAPNLVAAELGLRQVVTQVRLLRQAVELRRGNREALLADPLGAGPLSVAAAPDGFVVRSAGQRDRKPIERHVRR